MPAEANSGDASGIRAVNLSDDGARRAAGIA
jgi:hypothetical protein